MIIKKHGEEYIELGGLFFPTREKTPKEEEEQWKTAWVALGFPVFWWPLSLAVIIFGGIAIAYLGGT